jgi:secreted PhoX family phosphatase
VSLAGTYNNCAGGITPWGTWLTCEETETLAGGAITKNHGYVFEVDPLNLANNVDPTPIEGLGRYAHEAVAIDPSTGHVYLTEDASGPHGLVYRFVPNRPLGGYGFARRWGPPPCAARRPSAGADLCDFTEVGTVLDVAWAEVLIRRPSCRARPASSSPTARPSVPAATCPEPQVRGRPGGGGKVFIVCSYARVSDGSTTEHDGQVWSFDPLRARCASRCAGVNPDYTSTRPDGPDNITVRPTAVSSGEDGEGRLPAARHPQGRVFRRPQRPRRGRVDGPCFSPDGRTLFANLQEPAVKVAITGNWSRLGQI